LRVWRIRERAHAYWYVATSLAEAKYMHAGETSATDATFEQSIIGEVAMDEPIAISRFGLPGQELSRSAAEWIEVEGPGMLAHGPVIYPLV
jgi:hypothetical protein